MLFISTIQGLTVLQKTAKPLHLWFIKAGLHFHLLWSFITRQSTRITRLLPPFIPGCAWETNRQMELIYPEPNARIYIPMEINGQKGKTIFYAAHRNAGTKLFWHLNNNYLGTTTRLHQIAINPSKGLHTITVVDEQGETITRGFEILEKEKE